MITNLDWVTIWSQDLNNLLPFYRDTLGLQVREQSPGFVVLGGEREGPSVCLGTHSEVWELLTTYSCPVAATLLSQSFAGHAPEGGGSLPKHADDRPRVAGTAPVRCSRRPRSVFRGSRRAGASSGHARPDARTRAAFW